MKVGEAELLGMEFFVAQSLDTGFRNIDVFRTLQKVIATRKPVRGMNGVFRKYLTTSGYIYAMNFVDDYMALGLWGYMKKVSVELKECKNESV